jgi:hypothetical protein
MCRKKFWTSKFSWYIFGSQAAVVFCSILGIFFAEYEFQKWPVSLGKCTRKRVQTWGGNDQDV